LELKQTELLQINKLSDTLKKH